MSFVTSLRVHSCRVFPGPVAGFALALIASGSQLAYAQAANSAVPRWGVSSVFGGSPALPITAAEALARVVHVGREARNAVSNFRAEYPEDSIRAVVAAAAKTQLARLNGRGRTGLQMDAYAQLFVAAEHDDSAQTLINARVATPGISEAAQAYTYALAVRLFADHYRPARLSIAEGYLARLRALGPSTIVRQFQSELVLARAYYELFRYEDVARHGQAAMTLFSKVPYGARAEIFDPVTERYAMIVDAMTRMPNGRAAVETMNANLQSLLAPPLDSAKMGGWDGWGREAKNREDFKYALVAQARVGQRGGPLFSNYWVNVPDTSAHAIPVNDGKIRLLGFGSWTCGFCVSLGSSMQRIHQAFPEQVEAVFVTETAGAGWGNRIVSPAGQSLKLTDWIVHELGLKIPIALYRAPMIPDPDGAEGDMMSDYSGRADQARDYPWVGKPSMYLLDGTGTIRRVFAGFAGRKTEAQILNAVKHLIAERSAISTALSSTSSTP